MFEVKVAVPASKLARDIAIHFQPRECWQNWEKKKGVWLQSKADDLVPTLTGRR